MADTNGNSSSSNNHHHHHQDLGLYFLELSRYGSSRGPCDMDEDEEAPTELNTISSSGGFLVVSTDKLSVKYTNVPLHGYDVGVIQANKPAPTKRLVYYFEIYVKDAGAKGAMSIGFTIESFKMRRQPGWEVNSCGYHGDDGFLYHGHGKGEAFGPTYTSGDTVGGGINYATQEFFFTKNGQVIGTEYKDIKGPLFPTIAVHSLNEEVHVNFGQKRFAFDVKEFETQERMKQQLKIEEIPLPPNVSYGVMLHAQILFTKCAQTTDVTAATSAICAQFVKKDCTTYDWTNTNCFTCGPECEFQPVKLCWSVSPRIVRSYLLHYGYEDTLNSFDVASRSTVPPICIAQENGIVEQEITYALNHRKTLRQLIRNGEIDAALSKLREWYPQIVEDNTSATCFLLHCQKFIELVRVGALEEAVKYGRVELARFFGLPIFEDLVQDCVALLAYEQPQESSVGYLLQDSQREVVADTINAMILSTNPNVKESKNCLRSYLERLLRQLTACCLERRSLSGEQGEAFQLQRVLSSGKNG